MAVLPFDGAQHPDLFALERRSMDRPGHVLARLNASLPTAGTLLDVGAGDGWTARRLASARRRVIAVEPDAGMVVQAAPDRQVIWVRAEAGALPLADGSVDAAFATWAYFFPSRLDPSRGLAELHRVVRPGGTIAIVTNAGDDEFTRLSVARREDLGWFEDRGFHVEVVDTTYSFDGEDPQMVARLLTRYLGEEAGLPAPPTSLGYRVAVATCVSAGPPAIRIRAMRLAEATRVGTITVGSYDAEVRFSGDYRSFLADPLQRLDGCTALLVAVAAGQVVGTVSYVLPGDPAWEARSDPDGDCSFRVLAVAPGTQGRGTGRLLAQACITRAREEGRRRMLIASMASMARAHRLYAALGFVRRPDLDVRFPDGVGVVFTLDLVPDAAAHFPPPGRIPDPLPWYTDAWG